MSKRILIVEDEKSLADILKKGLEEEGYAVDVAYNGEDGLHLALNEPSDLMILDIMLPVVDGMTILKKVRRAGIKTMIIPKANEKDLDDIPKYLRKDMHFIFATTMDDVIATALRKTKARRIAHRRLPGRSRATH